MLEEFLVRSRSGGAVCDLLGPAPPFTSMPIPKASVLPLLLGPFLINPLPPNPPLPTLSPAIRGEEGSFGFGEDVVLVAAVRVSIGGGLIGTAIRLDVDEVVVVDRDEDVDAFLDILGDEEDWGSRGNTG